MSAFAADHDGQAMSVFATEDAARQTIVDAGRRLVALGVNHGSAGNVSLRWHRGGAEGLLITPSALPPELTGVDDIVWLSLETAADPRGGAADPQPRVVDGPRRPSSEWRMHRDLYATRPQAQAVVHAHAPHASALACLPRVQLEGIPAFHYMVAAAGGADIRCAPYATFGTQALSDHARAALEGRRACLLANHGLLALGVSLERALALAVEVEMLARLYAQALQLGEPVVLPADEMARVLERFGDYQRGADDRHGAD